MTTRQITSTTPNIVNYVEPGAVVRRARKAGRCDAIIGWAPIERCVNRIESGDLYVEGCPNEHAGGFARDRLCLAHFPDLAPASLDCEAAP